MSDLQQQAVRLISGLSDDNISFLIEIIRRLMPQGVSAAGAVSMQRNERMRAFQRLDAARSEIEQFITRNLDDFDKSEIPAISPEDFLTEVSC